LQLDAAPAGDRFRLHKDQAAAALALKRTSYLQPSAEQQ
jgi:hypothetical protein